MRPLVTRPPLVSPPCWGRWVTIRKDRANIRSIFLFLVAISFFAFLCSNAKPVEHRYRAKVNLEFFVKNNSLANAVVAFKGYATTLCMNDKASGNSYAEWLAASAKCYDSWESDTEGTSAQDGGWRDYRAQALAEVRDFCVGKEKLYSLCEIFK